MDLGAPEDALQGGRCPLKCKGTFGNGGHLQACAIPANGGYRRPVEAAGLKGLGVRPDVPEVIAFHRGQVYAIELKTESGRATELQTGGNRGDTCCWGSRTGQPWPGLRAGGRSTDTGNNYAHP